MEANHNYLVHYASPYYDPVKAHEYYMEHRVLKGRKSTAGLSDKGKEAAAYIKQRLKDEREAKVKRHKQETDTAASSIQRSVKAQNEAESNLASSQVAVNSQQVRDEISRHSSEMQSKIARLREQYSRMDSAARGRNRDALSAKINSLRIENDRQREKINAELAARNYEVRSSAKASNAKRSEEGRESIKSLRDTHSQYKKDTKAEYDSAYERELEGLSSEFKKQAKGRPTRSKSRSSGAVRQSSEVWKKFKAERDTAKRK